MYNNQTYIILAGICNLRKIKAYFFYIHGEVLSECYKFILY